MKPADPAPIFSALLLLLVLAGLDQTVLGTMLPTIAAALGNAELAPWVFTAYLTTATLAVPVYGKLADRAGPWPLLVAATALFTLGSAACAAAGSMPVLIAARAMQGLGGGGLMTLAMISVAWLYPPAERGRRMGMIGAAYSLATLVGPLAGGVLLRGLPWPSAFLVNLPCAAIAGVLIARHRFGTAAASPAPFDMLGTVLLCGALTACLWALRHPIASAEARTAAAFALDFGAAWAWVARRAADPIVPLALFRDPAFRAAAGLSALSGAVLFGAVVFVPLYLQTGRGLDALESAACVVPLMLGITVAGQLSGRALRSGRSFATVGVWAGALMAAGTATVALLLRWPALPTAAVAIALLPIGLGLGLCFPLTAIVAQRQAPPAQLGAASALPVMLRSLGGALAVALLGELLQRRGGDLRGGTSMVFAWLTGASALALPAAWRLRGRGLGAQTGAVAVPALATRGARVTPSTALPDRCAQKPPSGSR